MLSIQLAIKMYLFIMSTAMDIIICYYTKNIPQKIVLIITLAILLTFVIPFFTVSNFTTTCVNDNIKI